MIRYLLLKFLSFYVIAPLYKKRRWITSPVLASLPSIEYSYFCSQRKQITNLDQNVHLRENCPV